MTMSEMECMWFTQVLKGIQIRGHFLISVKKHKEAKTQAEMTHHVHFYFLWYENKIFAHFFYLFSSIIP